MTTVLHDSRLSDGRRVITQTIPEIPSDPPIVYETKIYYRDNVGIDVLDRYCYASDASDGHWNWVQSMSFGNPLPADFPDERRPY
jgi:hypothetical protein